MYKKEFDKLSSLPSYLLFYGDKFYLKEYEKKLEERFRGSDILKMGDGDFDFERAKIHLSESSLFGGESVLIIKSEKVIEQLKELIKHIKNGYLFYFYYGDKKPKLFGNNFVRFFEPSLREKIEYIDKLSQRFNVRITDEAKKRLALMVDAMFLEQEIEKLSLYSEEIGLREVNSLVFFYKEESLEEFAWMVFDGKDFFDELKFLLNFVDYRRILPFFIKYIKELYKYNLYLKKNNSSLEELLGYKLPFDIEKKRIDLAVRIREREFYELLKNLLEFEFRLRNFSDEAIFWEAMLFLKTFFSKL